jgi:uncharacterized coiled-coil protein SlyX
MAGVARVLELFGTRLDSLQMQIAQMDKNAQAGHGKYSGQRGLDILSEPPVSNKVAEMQEEITQFRKQMRDVKDGQAATFKKERSVTEAVLTQKIERMIGDKSAPSIRKVDDAQNDMAKLSDRVSAITSAVDKQAKFLTELNAKLTQSIDSAVERKVDEALAKLHNRKTSPESNDVVADVADQTNVDDASHASLDDLEESPDLGQIDPGVGDQIDMVAVGSGQAAKKAKAGKSRAKAKN